MREFFNYGYEEFSLSFDSRKLSMRPLLITIANTQQYGNGAIIAPKADFRDGLLDICIIHKIKPFEATTQLYKLFNGQIDTCSFYEHYRSEKVIIRREKDNAYLHTDGEPHVGNRELTLCVDTKKLNVCVPPKD